MSKVIERAWKWRKVPLVAGKSLEVVNAAKEGPVPNRKFSGQPRTVKREAGARLSCIKSYGNGATKGDAGPQLKAVIPIWSPGRF